MFNICENDKSTKALGGVSWLFLRSKNSQLKNLSPHAVK
jgi:hypothetical protein